MDEEIVTFLKRYNLRKRVISFIKKYEWTILIFSTVACWLLGFYGFTIYFERTGESESFTDIAYLTFQLFTFGSGYVEGEVPLVLDIVRFLAPFTLVYAAVIAFMWFIRHLYKLAVLRRYKDHTVFLGLGDLGRLLLRDLQHLGEKLVVVTKEEINPSERLLHPNTVFITKTHDEHDLLKQVRAKYAKRIMCMADGDEENLSTGFMAGEFINSMQLKEKPKIFVQASMLLVEQLQELDFENKASNNTPIIYDNIQFFNVYERAARNLVHTYSPDKFKSFTNSEDQAHILIAGFNKLGQALLLQAAKLYHFTNRKKLRATVFYQPEEEKGKMGFIANYPGIEEVVDLKFYELGRVNDRNVVGFTGDSGIQVIYICGNNDFDSLKIFNKTNMLIRNETRVVFCHQASKSVLSRLKRENIHHYFINEETLRVSSIIKNDMEEQAVKIHQLYMVKEKEKGQSAQLKALKQLTHKEWDKLTEQTKNQNRNQTEHIAIKLRTAGYKAVPSDDDEILSSFPDDEDMLELLAEMEHRRWNAEMLLNGWIYGEVRNEALKIHDNIIPYSKLEDPIKKYDREAVQNIPLILASVGLKVVPA